MERELNGQGPGPEASSAPRWEAAAPSTRMMGARGEKAAVIPIQGVLTHDGPAYYGSNYQTISDAVEKAVADSDVKRIVLAVDSPGGAVIGLPECAAVLAAAAKVKPVSAIVEGASASAAYWLTSQASDITLTPSGEVGSVGVRMMHVDQSRALDDAGITVTELHSGDFKTEWSPYKPLTDEAKADMQTRLNASYADFVSAITRGRGQRASADMRRSRYGNGRMHSAPEALAGGLVDRIQPAREFYKSLGGSTSLNPTPTMPHRAGRDAIPLSTQRARLLLERARARM